MTAREKAVAGLRRCVGVFLLVLSERVLAPGRRLLLAAALALLPAGCRGPRTDTLQIGHETEALSLDPAGPSEAATNSILSNVYDGLVAFDRDMRLVPALAVNWSSIDERTWLIKLRRGVRFHDGHTLSAADVKHTLERARADPASSVRGQLWSVESVAIVDGLTLRIRTLRPDPLLMMRLTRVLIVPDGWSVEGGHPVGTGPYRFVRWEKGHDLEVEAFPDCWAGKPRIRHVHFVPVEQGQNSLEALEQGHLDVLRDLPESLLDDVKKLPAMRVASRLGLASNYLWFDTLPGSARGRNPFSDRRVRQALSLAIGREELVGGLRGKGIAAHQLVQQGVFGYVETLPKLRLDPQEARALLALAGYPDGFETTLLYSSGTSAAAVVEALQGMLARVGVRVVPERREWPEMVSAWRAARLPFFLSGWRFENGDATSFLRDCLYTRDRQGTSGSYNPGFSDAELDRLIDENEQIFGEPKRRAQYATLMRYAMEQMPVVPLFHRYNLSAVSTRLRWEPRLDNKLLAAEMSWD